MEAHEVWQRVTVPAVKLHAEPVVRHREHHEALGAVAAHTDLEGAARRTELHRVGHQVLQDALELAVLDRDTSAGVEIGLGTATALADLLAELALDFGIDV